MVLVAMGTAVMFFGAAIPLMWVYFILVSLCTIIYWRLIRNPRETIAPQ